MDEPTPQLIDADVNDKDGNSRVAKDIFAGSMGGIAQVLSGQPFDTTKVRLQSSTPGQYDGSIDVIKQLVKNEGFKGFYKGTLTPLIGVGACVSIQFAVNEYMKRFFADYNNNKSNFKSSELKYSQFYLCGASAGIANSFLASPIEHIRIRLQTQSTVKLYNGPIDCIRKIYSNAGLKGIMRGLGPTLLREGHGAGCYFFAFEALVKNDVRTNNIKRSDIPGYRLCFYGAMAGYSMWLACYPIDVIKSKLQTDSLKASEQLYKNSWDCAKKTMKTYGLKGFFKGFVPTIMRAAPVNAITFYTFELTMRAIN